MNILNLVSGLFRHRWDPQVVTALEQGPLRFKELRYAITLQAGQLCDDSTLTRSLGRLAHDGIVIAEVKQIYGRDISFYQLTPRGHVHLDAYRAFLAAYEQLALSDGQHTIGIWPPPPLPAQPPTVPQDATGWQEEQP